MIEKTPNDTLSLWLEEGSRLIPENFDVFRTLVAQAKDLAQRGKYDAAAVYAEMAAFHAQWKHPGLFVSPELEHILHIIGHKGISKSLYSSKTITSDGKIKNILHVASNISILGGIPRFIWRLIQQDGERSHSLALTKQAPDEVPQIFRDAVNNSNGKIHVLNESIGGLVSRAKRLRKIAATADVVLLHTWDHDAIPCIAFADKEQSPPIIFVNHSDHGFWLGVNISNVVANLRSSGMHLSQERRSIETKRNALLPTILNPIYRKLSRTEAKQQLGIDESSVILVSIARSPKYKTIDGVSFADAHVPLLKQYNQAILIVIGPGDSEDWSAAIQQTQGRIKVLGETENTSVFYQAADIYVDSFPWTSITSLLEAGSYGVPLVSRYPYSSNACGILGADMPGLTGNLIRVQKLEEYTQILSRLIIEEEFRLSLGEATRRKIAQTHWGNNWQRSLNDVYVLATTLPRVTLTPDVKDKMFLGEPDVFLPVVIGKDFDFDGMIQSRLTIMPFSERLRHWLRLVKKYGVHRRIGLLFPEWFHLRYYSRLRSFLPF
ncbi:MAG: glycosyltransferase [Heteroscytonema crispum UTEX LB 1556]